MTQGAALYQLGRYDEARVLFEKSLATRERCALRLRPKPQGINARQG